MSKIQPFTIEIPDSALEDLHHRLKTTRFADSFDDPEFEYGASTADVKRLIKTWETGYDWRKHEAKLNELPHYRTKITIDGFEEMDVHFVHQRSETPGAIPLLFVHGWPGSFLEVTRLLPLLKATKPGEPGFHVVAPSLPNFGFSGRVTKKGFGISQYAEAMHLVMKALGYDEYVTQGGDWGFLITRALGHLYPEHVRAIHTNWANAPIPSALYSPWLFTTAMLKFVGQAPILNSIVPASWTYTRRQMKNFAMAKDWFEGSGRGYFAFLSTKPATYAHALADSPAALLALIYEKLHDWADSYDWTDDELLTWISIYWHSTAGPGASGYIYKEATAQLSMSSSSTASSTSAGPKTSSRPQITSMRQLQSRVSMPLGFTYFPKEIANMPREWTAQMGDVVFFGEYDKGGHFAAYERPDAIARDLKLMFGKGGGAFGVVKGCDGY